MSPGKGPILGAQFSRFQPFDDFVVPLISKSALGVSPIKQFPSLCGLPHKETILIRRPSHFSLPINLSWHDYGECYRPSSQISFRKGRLEMKDIILRALSCDPGPKIRLRIQKQMASELGIA